MPAVTLLDIELNELGNKKMTVCLYSKLAFEPVFGEYEIYSGTRRKLFSYRHHSQIDLLYFALGVCYVKGHITNKKRPSVFLQAFETFVQILLITCLISL